MVSLARENLRGVQRKWTTLVMIVRIFVALHITMQYHKNNNVEKKNIEKNEKEAKKNARPIKPYPSNALPLLGELQK